MPISQTESLIQLIQSLTTAEKRNFRLYANRNHSGESLKFIDLFDIIEKLKVVNDQAIFESLKNVSKPKYSNLKRHLYSQIITSLRLIHKTKRPNIEVREHIDYAYILYGKGLYLQALKILQLAKRKAIKNHLNYTHLTIVEFEKLIETRHITRSGEQRAAELVVEARTINETISNAVYLSNLRVELHGMYLRHGHNRNQTDQESLAHYFSDKLKHIKEDSLGVIERIYLFQSYVWYSYIQLDFYGCLKYAKKWVGMLEENTEMIHRDVDLYMRGYHYILTATFHLRDKKGLTIHLDQLEKFRKTEYSKLNGNSQIVSFLYVHAGRLNKTIINGDFETGLQQIPKTLKRIKRYRNKLDDHRVLVFYFKIAWIYFGANKIDQSIEYLNKIVNKEVVNLREDIQFYARLMFLMCHYEMENYESMKYLIKSFQSFFNRTKDHNTIQRDTLELFKALAKSPNFDHLDIMKKYLKQMDLLKLDSFYKNAFTYLDITSWLRSKITRRSLSEIVKKGL